MANTGILYRRNSKANLIADPPILGEIVFAIDTEEYGALVNNQLMWRPHIIGFNDIQDRPNVNYSFTGDALANVTIQLGNHVTIPVTVEKASGSFAVGETTPTAKPHSFVTGTWNEQKATAVVEVGIGTDANNKQNAFEIHDDGTVVAPAMTPDKIVSDHVLVTKKYIDDLVIDCGEFAL